MSCCVNVLYLLADFARVYKLPSQHGAAFFRRFPADRLPLRCWQPDATRGSRKFVLDERLDISARDAITPSTLSVWRGDADGGGYESFAVPKQPSQTVLDVVTWIQQQADPTLTYRFACRVGMCGSCAMMVNDEPRWTCRTHVERVARQWRDPDCAASQPAGDQGSGDGHGPVLREMGESGSNASRLGRRNDDFAAVLPDDPSASRPAPASNASTAPSATPHAIRLPAIRTILARRRCNAPGPSIMTPVTRWRCHPRRGIGKRRMPQLPFDGKLHALLPERS